MIEPATLRRLDALLPGLRRAVRGGARGWLALSAWVGLWSLALWRRGRVGSTLTDGSLEEWLALGTLVLALGLVWWWGRREEASGASPLGLPDATWRRFRRHRGATLGLVLLAALCLSALLTPYLAPHDPTAQERVVETRYLAPSAEHPLGTDRFGRDVLSRVLYGARISLGIGIAAILISITLGTLAGAVAGYAGGWLDTAVMRGVDLLLSFPRLVLLIAVVALFEPSVTLVTVVLGLTGWMGTSRIVRGEVLSVRETEYVQAARALGYGDGRILLRHVLPNTLTPVIVAATLGVGNTILAEAALSFLGLGVQPPTPSWGNMVAAGKSAMIDAWWITLFPGLAIVATVMSFNLVGDGLRDALDPRFSEIP